MSLPPWLHFFRRPLPSANMVLLTTERPVLIDTGFGSDADATLQLVQQAGVSPDALHLVLNTHAHSDHCGGNAALQQQGLRIATSRHDAQLINSRSIDACDAHYLGQSILPYHVDQSLDEGDEIDLGEVTLRVFTTPGHAAGQIAFYIPEEELLICGDTVHADDVAWIDAGRLGTAGVEQAIASVEKVSRLGVRWAASGHGPAIVDPPAAFSSAIARYRRWLDDPKKIGWHACKRIFTSALMFSDGMTADEATEYLCSTHWFRAFCQNLFHIEPSELAPMLLGELTRSGAARWQNDVLTPTTPYTHHPRIWHPAATFPQNWPMAN